MIVIIRPFPPFMQQRKECMRKAVYVRIGFISKFILKKEPVIGFSIVLAILHKYRKRLNRILAYDVLLQGGEGMKPMKRPDIDDLLYVAACMSMCIAAADNYKTEAPAGGSLLLSK